MGCSDKCYIRRECPQNPKLFALIFRSAYNEPLSKYCATVKSVVKHTHRLINNTNAVIPDTVE